MCVDRITSPLVPFSMVTAPRLPEPSLTTVPRRMTPSERAVLMISAVCPIPANLVIGNYLVVNGILPVKEVLGARAGKMLVGFP